jgi:P4 family phage/plasmid primase-like protien
MSATTNYAAFGKKVTLSKDIHLSESDLIKEIIFNKGKSLYHCYYNLEPRDTFKEYEGKMSLAFGQINFDFDDHSGGDEALKDAKDFCNKLESEGIFFKIYFSGNKGFHVACPAAAFGLSGEFEKASLEAKMKSIFQNLKKTYKSVDTGIWNANRKFRAYRSRHEESGLYKIEIPFDQIDGLTIARIRELAVTQPPAAYDPYLDDDSENDWAMSLCELKESYANGNGHVIVDAKPLNLDNIQKSFSNFESFREKKCIKDMRSRLLPDFNRHDIGMRILSDLKNTGTLKESARATMEKWAKSVFEKDPNFTERLVDTLRMVEDAYSQPKYYSFGCYDPVRKAYCTSKCKIFEKLDREKRANPLDLKSKSKKISTLDLEDAPYEQIGYYFRYEITKPEGGIKTVDVPQYKLMADACFEAKNICCDDSLSMKFDGKKWYWMSKTELLNFIITENKECIKPAHLDNFVKIIKGTCFEKALEFESSDGFINVQNGIVNVKTGELIPHSYKYMFRYCTDANYDPSAQCPAWLKFLDDTFSGDSELKDLAQRLFGYVMIGGRPFLHKAFVLYGEGRNGKSTFLDILKAVIGEKSYSVVSMSKLDREFSLTMLNGVLANIAEETPTDEINAEVFKTLVGGGQVVASHKGYDEYSFQCNARFIFACNDMPVFKDKSVGLEDRLVFIPFSRYIREEDRDTRIVEKLLAELPGILNWAIDGAKTIFKERRLPTYEATNRIKETYKEETDPLYAWVKENIAFENDESLFETIEYIYTKYQYSSTTAGNKPYSKINFSRRLKKMMKAKCEEMGLIDPYSKLHGGIRGYKYIKYIGEIFGTPSHFHR